MWHCALKMALRALRNKAWFYFLFQLAFVTLFSLYMMVLAEAEKHRGSACFLLDGDGCCDML